MNENQAQVLLNFIDSNWSSFETIAEEHKEDPESIRSEIEKVAMGD